MDRGPATPGDYDIAVDFMDMTNDGRVWVRADDVRNGREVEQVGAHFVVGDDDADPKVARVLAVDDDGNIELLVLPGAVEFYTALLAPA